MEWKGNSISAKNGKQNKEQSINENVSKRLILHAKTLSSQVYLLAQFRELKIEYPDWYNWNSLHFRCHIVLIFISSFDQCTIANIRC
jgi:hypothetical protein